MKRLTIFFAITLVMMVGVGSTLGQTTFSNPAWNVILTYGGQTTARQMTLIQMPNGVASYSFGPSVTTQPLVFPAVWRRTTPSFMSFSGEVNLPLGNGVIETGTLVLKATSITTTGTMIGPVIFVLNTPGSPYPYVIQTGNFTATRIPVLTTGFDEQ